MKITKEQIKELSQINSQTAFWCKKNYPEAFEVEVGKWYKSGTKAIFNHQENLKSYGFLNGKYLDNNWGTKAEYWDAFPVEATEAEVFEALKNEAVKRYRNASCIPLNKHLFSDYRNEFNIPDFSKYCEFESGKFWVDFGEWNAVIFENGKWAEIIPTITRAEAEKQLNKKIID